MDRPLRNTEKRKDRLRQVLRIGLILLVLGGAFWGLRAVLKTEIATKDFRLATVERGSIENSITATGLVVPIFEQQINAPVSAEVKAVLLTSGAEVKVGTIIMELDEEFTRLAYESLDDELELKQNNITKLKLEYDKNLKELAYENEIKGLQLSSLEAELSDKKRLKAIGGTTQEEVDRAALNLKIAQLEKKKLENDLQFREVAIVSDQRNLELEVLIQDKKKRELEKKLTQTKVTAPRAGVITWIQEKIGQKVSEGEPLVRIADLEQFRVEASCSDRYANSVHIGLPVRVRVNKSELTGKITSISPAVENNTLSFIVELDEKNHPALRPDMRVEVFVVSDIRANILRVKNGPAFKGGVQQSVFVITGDKAIKRSVRVGLTNIDFVEITEGLQAGDQIILSDMKDYEYLEELKMKN